MRVALVQQHAGADREENLERSLRAMDEAAEAGAEGDLTFAGESFVVDSEGQVIARGEALEDDLVVADLDLAACERSTARRLFWRDRRPEIVDDLLG